MAAPRDHPPAAAQRMTTTTRNAGRSESTPAQSPLRTVDSMFEDEELVCTISVLKRGFNIIKSLSGMSLI